MYQLNLGVLDDVQLQMHYPVLSIGSACLRWNHCQMLVAAHRLEFFGHRVRRRDMQDHNILKSTNVSRIDDREIPWSLVPDQRSSIIIMKKNMNPPWNSAGKISEIASEMLQTDLCFSDCGAQALCSASALPPRRSPSIASQNANPIHNANRCGI